MFGGVKLAKNADLDKYIYSSYGIGFDNKGKDILILSKGPIQGWDDATLIAKAQYSISFSRSNRKFFLSLHYNGSNNFLFVNFLFATKINKFKAKVSEIKKNSLCLGNISGNFLANKMKKKKQY